MIRLLSLLSIMELSLRHGNVHSVSELKYRRGIYDVRIRELIRVNRGKLSDLKFLSLSKTNSETVRYS
jgi:hypothetical protein